MKARMAEYYKRLKETPMWDTSREMMMPGEIEYNQAPKRLKTGVPVPIKTYEELVELKKVHELKSPLTTLES